MEAAILEGTKSELQWTKEYCRRRARIAWILTIKNALNTGFG